VVLGHVVEIAFDGAAALEKIEELIPDLIVSDAMMPVMNGPELIAEVRRRPRLERIPVILMSGSLRTEEARRLGVPLLRKPFDLRQLTAALDGLRR
jgi:CheY-like chemotaxis protein